MMSQDKRQTQTIVFATDIQARPAPIRQVGIIAWMRQNLFRTWLDVFLTIGGIIIALWAVVSLVNWTVSSANWWAISFNFRQFMLGRYEAIYEWRVVVATIVTVFCCGMAVAMWIRQISRLAFISVVSLLAMLFIFPTIVITVVPMPQTFIATSPEPIVIGSATETTPTHVGFIGKSGEQIMVHLVDTDAISTDEALSGLSGFMDSATNLMRTNAGNRLTTIARDAELRNLLEQDAQSDIPIFTTRQRQQRQTELERIQIPPPIVETFGVGMPSVRVDILDTDFNPIADAVLLTTPDDRATFTLPADGWYVLHMTIPEGEAGIAILSLVGVYPIIRSTALAGAEEGATTTGFASTYIRMTDNFEIGATLPKLAGQDIPFYNIVNNQYRGNRDVETYLRIYLAPFLQKISIGAGILLMVSVAGYFFALFIARATSKKQANRVTSYAMIILPLFIWVMLAGLTIPEIFNLTVVFAGVIFVLFMFYMGNYLGRTTITLGVLLIVALGIVLLPTWVFETTYGFGMLPIFNLLIIIPATIAWLAGSATYGALDGSTIRRNFLITGVLLIALLIVPKLILTSGLIDLRRAYPEWFLAASDQRRWGGLLLTMVLTIFGIIAAFPIGVGLALGRRSKLPAIKYGCTLFIELVRGSPFVAVLFMMQLMIPLINPAFTQIPGTIRALVAVIIFSAAYLAENVRGGLQSLPPGQTEAARALGLSAWQVTLLITLPQALRAVIPALVGQFIALFKDTSLVAIVGLTDLTGFVGVMTVQAEFIGTRAEGLFFITLIYFVFSYVMAYVSRLLEASGSGKTRRL